MSRILSNNIMARRIISLVFLGISFCLAIPPVPSNWPEDAKFTIGTIGALVFFVFSILLETENMKKGDYAILVLKSIIYFIFLSIIIIRINA